MIEGYAKVTVKGKVFDLNPDETLLIPPGANFLKIPEYRFP
jgi:mannose-6-phosphate isomerase-like protein (cupin superfamily)